MTAQYSLGVTYKEQIIAAVQKHGTRNVEMVTYDLKIKKLLLWDKNDHDTCVQSLTLNPYSQKLYASLFFFKDRDQKVHKYEQQQTAFVKPPTY